MSAVLAVCGILSYKGRESGAMRFAFATLLVYVTLTPILSLIHSEGGLRLPDHGFDPEDYSKDYYNVAQSAFCDGIERLICEEYALDADEVRVGAVGFSFEYMRAEKIEIVLSGKAALADRVGIEKFVNKQGFGACEVEIEIG